MIKDFDTIMKFVQLLQIFVMLGIYPLSQKLGELTNKINNLEIKLYKEFVTKAENEKAIERIETAKS